MTSREWIDAISDLQAIAQTGLQYGKDPYDRERYQNIRDIAAKMMAAAADLPLPVVKDLFCKDSGYPTPKVDTRGAVFDETGRILLVHEANGTWSLPGGWCDYNLSPMDNTVKEIREEAGLTVSCERVIAVQQREKHNQPRYPFTVVKIFYLCRAQGGSFAKNLETTESRYFSREELPENMAGEKCTKEQVLLCFAFYDHPDQPTQFD
ncbi:MAG: NUDIX hydrolase N-terminal domain-containing protein [Lachnospiraceae bacterium]